MNPSREAALELRQALDVLNNVSQRKCEVQMEILDTVNDLEEILRGIQTEDIIGDLGNHAKRTLLFRRRTGIERSLRKLKNELKIWTAKTVKAQRQYDRIMRAWHANPGKLEQDPQLDFT